VRDAPAASSVILALSPYLIAEVLVIESQVANQTQLLIIHNHFLANHLGSWAPSASWPRSTPMR
jgi:hypothetical protein